MSKLENVYYSSANPAGFSCVSTIWSIMGLKTNEVKVWLKMQNVCILLKLKQHTNWHYPPAKIIARGIDDEWLAGLMEMQFLAQHNDGNRHMLMNVNCFSHYKWVRPLKTKAGEDAQDDLQKKNLMKAEFPENCRQRKGISKHSSANFIKRF